jgi:hypothetical protein
LYYIFFFIVVGFHEFGTKSTCYRTLELVKNDLL